MEEYEYSSAPGSEEKGRGGRKDQVFEMMQGI